MQIYLLYGSRLFHLAQEACADKGIEAEVLLAFACFGIDGCIGFGFIQLGFEAVLPVLERSQFFGGRRCRAVGMVGRVGSSIRQRFGWKQDAVGFCAGLLETKLMLQFLSLSRFLFPVAWVLNFVGFMLGHAFDVSFGIAISLAAGDCSAFGERAVEFTDRVFKYCSCHSLCYFWGLICFLGGAGMVSPPYERYLQLVWFWFGYNLIIT